MTMTCDIIPAEWSWSILREWERNPKRVEIRDRDGWPCLYAGGKLLGRIAEVRTGREALEQRCRILGIVQGPGLRGQIIVEAEDDRRR